MRSSFICLTALFFMLLAGCGGGSTSVNPSGPNQRNTPAIPITAPGSDSETLPSETLPKEDTSWLVRSVQAGDLACLSQRDLIVSEQPLQDGSVKLNISTSTTAQALFCAVTFNSNRFSVATADFRPVAAGMLQLGVQDSPGSFALGLIADPGGRLRPGPLASVTLRPPAAGSLHGSSAALQKTSGTASFRYDHIKQAFMWENVDLQGDFNQDGRVDFADMALIGQYFGKRPYDFFPDGPVSLVDRIDSNGNGVVDIQDITGLAPNFGVAIDSFALYGSPRPGDYPSSALQAPASPALANIAYRLPSDEEQDVPDYEINWPGIRSNWNYWVRTVSHGVSGKPSPAVNVGTEVQQALDIQADPEMFLYSGNLSGLTYKVYDQGSYRRVIIYALNATDIRNVVLNLKFNPAKYGPGFMMGDPLERRLAEFDDQSFQVESFVSGSLKLWCYENTGLTQSVVPLGQFFLEEAVFEPTRLNAPHVYRGSPDPALERFSFDPVQRRLSWYFVHDSDPTQDGLVDAVDLSSIGEVFNAQPQFDDLDSLARMADMNGDDHISVQDMTPVGLHLFSALDSYRIYASDRPRGQGLATLIRTVPLSAALGQRASERVHFDIPFDMPAGTYVWYVQTYRGEEGGQSSVIRLP